MHPTNRIDWHADALQQDLGHLWPGLRVQVLASVDSTSTRLLEECRAQPASEFIATLLVAEHQSRGRGRSGRAWHSASGASLTFSLAVVLQREDWSGLSLAVGAALADALDAPGEADSAAPRLMLKWPNDLWLHGRKLGGVLIETVSGGAQRIAVIGIGLNVLPLTVPDASSGVACLRELDPGMSAPHALRRVAAPLLRALRSFERSGFSAFEPCYQARDLLRGRDVVAGALHGVAMGIAPSGALRLRCDDGPLAPVREIVSGEVSVRLLAPPHTPALAGFDTAAPTAAC